MRVPAGSGPVHRSARMRGYHVYAHAPRLSAPDPAGGRLHARGRLSGSGRRPRRHLPPPAYLRGRRLAHHGELRRGRRPRGSDDRGAPGIDERTGFRQHVPLAGAGSASRERRTRCGRRGRRRDDEPVLHAGRCRARPVAGRPRRPATGRLHPGHRRRAHAAPVEPRERGTAAGRTRLHGPPVAAAGATPPSPTTSSSCGKRRTART